MPKKNSDYSETPMLEGAQLAKLAIQPEPKYSSHPSSNATHEKALVDITAYKEPRTLTVRIHQAVPNISSYLSHSAEAQDTKADKRLATLFCKLLTQYLLYATKF